MSSPLGSAAVSDSKRVSDLIQLYSKQRIITARFTNILQVDSWRRISAKVYRKSVNRSQNRCRKTWTDEEATMVIRPSKVKPNWTTILTGHKNLGENVEVLATAPSMENHFPRFHLKSRQTWERTQTLQPLSYNDVGWVPQVAGQEAIFAFRAIFKTKTPARSFHSLGQQ